MFFLLISDLFLAQIRCIGRCVLCNYLLCNKS